MTKGRVYIISGPSGSGKDSLMKKVFEKAPHIAFSISSITRPMRPGEVEGEKYNFISRERFEEMIANDELLEHNVFVGNYYGTPKAPVINCIENGKDMLIEVDVNGAVQIREKMPDVVSIFIMPPSLGELSRRLKNRGTETEEDICRRLKIAEDEIQRAKEYNYIVINDDLSVCVNDVLSIIKAERLKYSNMQEKIIEIINN